MSSRNEIPEVNDPAIKLFGTSIPMSEFDSTDTCHTSGEPVGVPEDLCTTVPEEPCSTEDSDHEVRNSASEGPETTSAEQQNTEEVDKNPETTKAAPLKKPDKILPCPRCNSMKTKFCYFNNYNVNQPRHFCRSCQRYWTAGGSIRNVPVGAGRRKSKHSSSQIQPVVIPASAGNFTEVTLINPESLLCKSVANKLTLEETKQLLEACDGARTGVPSSSCSSMSANEGSHEAVKAEKAGLPDVGFTQLNTLQGFPGPPPYPWNLGWNGMAYVNGGNNGNALLVPWNAPPMAINPGLCMPNITFPFLTPMCWGWDANRSSSPGSSSGNSSPLGKHSRDSESQEEEKTEKCFWVPKTLRIDDPKEAAKSSIWSTLGIKLGKREPISKGGMFKAFQPSTEENAETSEADKALQANPAALSRSQAFQESTEIK